ncbi:MAG: diguanylate cyclase (GGDEF)-like protein [Cellvibrionaceae bacterium]|jgi:diguanylate cyclase (GGDEF)-like protein
MLYDRLDLALKKSQRSRSKLALLCLDLDKCKEVNDTLGHDVGDKLLKEAGRRLST